MNRIVHFEIPVDEPERAKEFYEKTFGWEIKKWESPDSEMDYWLIMTGPKDEPGINGGLYKRMGQANLSDEPGLAVNYVCTVGVLDINEIVQKVRSNGGEILQEPQEVPKVGILAYARDTEGNIFGLMQGFPM